MKKYLPLVAAVALLLVLAVAVSTQADVAQQDEAPQGASVCLQWATVTPQVCDCVPTATPVVRPRPPVSPYLSSGLWLPGIVRRPPPASPFQ